MMTQSKHLKVSLKGFTLIEVMLVLVIVSIIIWASVGYVQQKALQMRIDRASIQMQQILNAGMAYYVSNGHWPATIGDLLGTYLPSQMKNPWGQDYTTAVYSPPTTPPANPIPPLFYVFAPTVQLSAGTGSAAAAANVIAGALPLSYTTTNGGGSSTQPPLEGAPCDVNSSACYVVASVNIPGQELSNARSVNFAGLYKHGGCIPVPQCPTDSTGVVVMTPQVMVVPVSVSGVNDEGSQNVYPISSFTAYATGPAPTSPPVCAQSNFVQGGFDCSVAENVGQPAQAYWRACLQVVTEKGNVAVTRTDTWGSNVTLMAITRCAVTNEPAGTSFNVFSN